jgi:hypothetical protein
LGITNKGGGEDGKRDGRRTTDNFIFLFEGDLAQLTPRPSVVKRNASATHQKTYSSLSNLLRRTSSSQKTPLPMTIRMRSSHLRNYHLICSLPHINKTSLHVITVTLSSHDGGCAGRDGHVEERDDIVDDGAEMLRT